MNSGFVAHEFYILPEKISLFRFILEGYDGLAILTTLDATKGLVRILVHQTRDREFCLLFKSISHDLTNISSY